MSVPHTPGCQCHAVLCRTARGLIVDGVDLVPMPAPPPPATDLHEPKEPRRAPTREEFENRVMRLMGACDPRSVFENSFRAVVAEYNTLAAERDEWRRRAEESDALNEGLNLALRLAQDDRDRHEAHAKTESTRARKAEALAAKKLVDYADLDIRHDALLARADKAEAERDAARALVRDLRDSSPCDHFDHHGHCQTHGWMETDPPCPHGRATKLLEALGEK